MHFLAQLACDSCLLYLIDHLNDRFNYGSGSADIDQYNYMACWSLITSLGNRELTQWKVFAAVFRSLQTKPRDDFYFDFIVSVLIPAGQAQNEGLHQFIDRHKNDPGLSFAYLSQDLFEVVNKSQVEEKDWKKLQQLVKNIGSLRILAGDNILAGPALYKDALAQIPANEFDELMTIRAEQTNVRIWSKNDADQITDLILLVCFAGNLELGNLQELARLFDAGQAEDLVAATRAVAIDFQINPNPSHGVFMLSYADAGQTPALLRVMDQQGRTISMLRLTGGAVQRVELPALPAGLYWVQMQTAQGKIGVKQLQIL